MLLQHRITQPAKAPIVTLGEDSHNHLGLGTIFASKLCHLLLSEAGLYSYAFMLLFKTPARLRGVGHRHVIGCPPAAHVTLFRSLGLWLAAAGIGRAQTLRCIAR